jgi:hypothetical protein
MRALCHPPGWTSPRLSDDAEDEHERDGSLFLAASTETSDCSNAMHLRAARAIHGQVDMLDDTVPFRGPSGRSDRVPPFSGALRPSWRA